MATKTNRNPIAETVMKTHSLAVRLLVLPVFAAAITACGGGGGGGDGNNSRSASFSVSPTALTFSAARASAGQPANQAITGTVSGTVNGNLYINVSLSGTVVAVPNVVINGSNTGEASVVPTLPSVLGPGTHTDTITIRACTTDVSCTTGQLAGSPRTVAVTYTINGLKPAPTSLTYTIGDTATSADLAKQVQLSGFPVNVGWTAVSSASWLTVPSSGALVNAAGQFTASLDQTGLDALVNASYSATITLTPASGDAITIPVTLNLQRSEVSYVSPYAVTAGVGHQVIIRGTNFPLNPSVSFGGVAASGVTRVSDNEIRATYPTTLPVGSHPVQVSGVSRSRAALVAVNVPAYVAEKLSYPAGFTPTRIAYDAERQALLVVLSHDLSSANNGFVRFSYASGSWGAADIHPTHNQTDMALSTDGTEWLVTRYAPISVQSYDAVDLSLRSTFLDTDFPNSAYASRLVVANDGFAITGGRSFSECGLLARYQIRVPSYTHYSLSGCSAFFGASADGSIVIAGTNVSRENERYVASTQVLEPIPPSLELTSAPVLDRHATRVVLNNTRVYDANFTLLGQLPATTRNVVLSPNGSIAWSYDASGQVRRFDLLATPVAGLFVEVGSGTTLVASPDADADGEVVMTSTPEGEVLFIAGDDGVIVQPSP